MTEKEFGTAEDVFESQRELHEDVLIPEWGNKWYRVKGLTARQRENYEASIGYVKGDRWVSKGNVQARLVVATVIDESGKALFGEQDIPKLSNLPAVGLRRIVEVARRLSGMTEDEMEWLEGNSDGAQSEPSSSSSPSLSGAPSMNYSTPARAVS